MNKTKLTKKETALSVLLFFLCFVVLVAVIFLLLIFTKGKDTYDFIIANKEVVLTVCLSMLVLFIITYIYLYFENKQMLAKKKKIVELFLMYILSFTLCSVVGKYVDPMARPLLLFALLAGKLFKRSDAIFTNSVYAILFIFNQYIMTLGTAESSTVGGVQIESFIGLSTVFCGGMVAVFIIQRIKTRISSVIATFVLCIPVIVINISMQIPFIEGNEMLTVCLMTLLYSALDCVFSVLIFMFILPVFEAVFAELTSFRLRELTSDNAKLIKKLKENAFGTYNHSIVVAQLAEACASAINEDPELARAAAYYHDVGKLKNPEMFGENQSDYDLHKELTPELSVDIIRSHTRDGAKLIKKYHLPEFFADVAVQHHGTMPIKYFYAKALKMSDGALNANNYSYTGPTPTTKIAAIIMIADASEAASRSLSNRSPENVEALVRSLVEERMNMDQFVDCDITMRELTIITRVLTNSLTGVYHSRVAYPKLVLSKKNK